MKTGRLYALVFISLIMVVGALVASRWEWNQRGPGCSGISNLSEHPQSFFAGRLPEGAYAEVVLGHRQDALSELGQNDLKLINQERATTLTAGKNFTEDTDKARYYYLLRAKRITASGAFDVYMKGDEILVIHGDLGRASCKDAFDTSLVVASNKAIKKSSSQSRWRSSGLS